MCSVQYIFFLYLLHPGIWEMSEGFTFHIISLIHVPGMKALSPDSLELIVLIQDYDGCRKRPLCPVDLTG